METKSGRFLKVNQCVRDISDKDVQYKGAHKICTRFNGDMTLLKQCAVNYYEGRQNSGWEAVEELREFEACKKNMLVFPQQQRWSQK